MTYHQTKQSISHKEAICIIQRAFKIQEIVTQTLFPGVMAVRSRVKQAMEMEVFHPKMAKMLQNNKLISQKELSTISQYQINLLDQGPNFPYFKIRKLQTKSLALSGLSQRILMSVWYEKQMRIELQSFSTLFSL